MKKAKVTVQDVAVKAGVSATTVSMVLNGRKAFPEETCRRVIDACNLLGYAHRESYRDENFEKKILIAIVPTLSNLYFVQVVQTMQRRAKERGYSILTFETFRERAQEGKILDICCNYPCAGVMLFYPPENSLSLQQLEAAKPVLHIYDKGVYEESNIIELDGLRIGSLIGKYLLQLGHERIAFLTLDFEMKQVMRVRRLEGLRKVYAERGFDPLESVQVFTPKKVLPEAKTKLDGYDLGYAITKALLRREENITALVGLNDMIAIGAMDAILAAGKGVPEDYSVCGCDNVSVSGYRGISLTTVDSFLTKAGKDAVDFIIEQVEENSAPVRVEEDSRPRCVTHIEYFPELIVRNSTGPCACPHGPAVPHAP